MAQAGDGFEPAAMYRCAVLPRPAWRAVLVSAVMSRFPPNIRTAAALAVLAAFLASPVRGQAPAVDEASALRELRPATMVAALAEIGHTVTVAEEDAVRAKLAPKDNTYALHLEGCAAGLCRFIQIRICVPASRATLETANRWNTTRVYARAAVYPAGLYCLENSVYTADGRITLAALRSAIDGLMVNAPGLWAEHGAK